MMKAALTQKALALSFITRTGFATTFIKANVHNVLLIFNSLTLLSQWNQNVTALVANTRYATYLVVRSPPQCIRCGRNLAQP